jgi:hypothetical protein
VLPFGAAEAVANTDVSMVCVGTTSGESYNGAWLRPGDGMGSLRRVVVTPTGPFFSCIEAWVAVDWSRSPRQQKVVRRETGNQGGNHQRMKGRVAVPRGVITPAESRKATVGPCR